MPFSRIAKDIRDLRRFKQIILVLFKFQFGGFLKKTRLKRELPLKNRLEHEKSENLKKQPERVRKVLEELGGTFVKLGQLLSLRPDLIPDKYCNEFRKLQDNVKPFPVSKARSIIEKELRKPIEELFKSFEPEPIAAASIGQVHRAVLKSGEKVVIKVRRPGIDELVETDIDILCYIAHLVEKHYKNLFFDPTEIIKEFEKYTEQELNYVLEGKNVDKFHRNFKNSKTIVIPKVIWPYTTKRVLTLEYIDGAKGSKLQNSQKYNKKKINTNLVNAVLKQIFIDGYFHADPHPGNILVLNKNRIAMLDFGIVGVLSKDMQDKISRLFIGLIQGDIDGIATGLMELGFVDLTVDLEVLKEDLRDNFREFYNTSIKHIKIKEVFPKLIEVAKKHQIILPSNFVLLGKSLMTTEGFCAELDPGFNLVKAAKPFVKRLVILRASPSHAFARWKGTTNEIKNFVNQIPANSREVIRGIREADLGFRAIDRDLQRLTTNVDRSSSRIALGVVIAALIIGGAMLFDIEKPQVFGFSFYTLVGAIVLLFLFLIFLSSIFQYKRKF